MLDTNLHTIIDTINCYAPKFHKSLFKNNVDLPLSRAEKPSFKVKDLPPLKLLPIDLKQFLQNYQVDILNIWSYANKHCLPSVRTSQYNHAKNLWPLEKKGWLWLSANSIRTSRFVLSYEKGYLCTDRDFLRILFRLVCLFICSFKEQTVSIYTQRHW